MKITTKTMTHTLVAAMCATLFAVGGAGCTAHFATRPALVVEPAPVVVHHAPARVYHGGRWLQYRSDGYYYHHRGHWVVASAVPHHVRSYHRPTHVYRGRPAHARRSVAHRAPAHRGRHRRHHKVDATAHKGPLALTLPAS